MNRNFLQAAAMLSLLALGTTVAVAQQDDDKAVIVTGHAKNSDVIEIRRKSNKDVKITIDIKGDDIKINGKPIGDAENDDVTIVRRKNVPGDVVVRGYPASRFRGGNTAFDYNYENNLNLNLTSASGNKAFLGVGTENIEGSEGVSVTNVTKESAAEKAGLKEGDVITKINDTRITNPGELTRAIGVYKPEEKITITYKRDKKEQKATAMLTKRKNNNDLFTLNAPNYNMYKSFNLDNNDNFNFNWTGKPRLGLKAQETEEGKGLKVLDIDDESTAEKAGIKEGDIITSFDGTEVNTVEKLGELAMPAIEKGNFKITVTRDGKPQEITVKIPKKLKSTNL